MRFSTRQFLFLVLMVGLVLMHESRTSLKTGETAFLHWLSANAPRQVETAPLVLVQISDEDIKPPHPWPWMPVDYSLFVNAALPFKPPVLAVEPVLAWKNPDPQQMTLLHTQALRAPKLLLGSEFGFPEDPALLPPPQEVPVLRNIKDGIGGLREFPLVALQSNEEMRLSATIGFFEPQPEDGKAVCRVPLVFRYRGQVVPSFVLQAAMLWFSVTPEDVTMVSGSYIALGKDIRLPVDEEGTMPIDFTIPVVRFPLADLILSVEQYQSGHQTIAPVARLKNSLTLLARTDTTARTITLGNGRLGSRGELAAAAIATIQKGSFASHSGLVVDSIILLEGLVLGWFCIRLGKLQAVVLCIGIFSFYMLGALGVFAALQVALPLLLPAGLLAFIVLFRQLD